MSQEPSTTTSYVEGHTRNERSNVTGKRDRILSLSQHKTRVPLKISYIVDLPGVMIHNLFICFTIYNTILLVLTSIFFVNNQHYSTA